MTEDAEREVLDAAAGVVAAFGSHDTAAYFAGFRTDATFVFHTSPEPLRSRADYERLWASWEEDGFHVLGCTSSEQHVQLLGDRADVAVFTHRVATRLLPGADADEEVLDERETIVFVRDGDRWLAVHEHLSAVPA